MGQRAAFLNSGTAQFRGGLLLLNFLGQLSTHGLITHYPLKYTKELGTGYKGHILTPLNFLKSKSVIVYVSERVAYSSKAKILRKFLRIAP